VLAVFWLSAASSPTIQPISSRPATTDTGAPTRGNPAVATAAIAALPPTKTARSATGRA
jgi:hypothetical protein